MAVTGGTRYALFMGAAYEANGGWNDMAILGSLDECKAFALRHGPPGEPRLMPEWAHIVDMHEKRMVCFLVWHGEEPWPPPLTKDLGRARKYTAEWVDDSTG